MTTPKLLSGERLADLMSEVPSQAWVDEVMDHISALVAELAQAKADAAEYRRAMMEIATQRDAESSRADAAEDARDEAVADNAKMLDLLRRADSGHSSRMFWDEVTAAVRSLHPGAALLEEVETLRQRQALWEEAAHALYGYTEFIGPCAHGRDPWDRCDECGEKNAVSAAVGLLNKEREEHRKALVLARNEGLEKAAHAAWNNEPDSRIANIIRSMKEPEQ